MDTSHAEHVAGAVRAEMARRKVSQRQLGAVLGMSQQAVARRVSGQVAFDVNELMAVAQHLGVSPTSLLPAVSDAGRAA